MNEGPGIDETPSEKVIEPLGLTLANSNDFVNILRCGTCLKSGVPGYAQSTQPYAGTVWDKYSSYHQWCVKVFCSRHHLWHACKSCHVRVRKMARHHLAHHVDDDVTGNDVADFPVDNDDDQSQQLEGEGETMEGEMSMVPGTEEPGPSLLRKKSRHDALDRVSKLPASIKMEREASTQYFKSEHQNGKGRESLVAGAFRQLDHPLANARPKETLYHLKCTKFLKSLTKGQVEQFAELNGLIMELSANHGEMVSRPAVSVSDVRRFYLRGPHSITQKLPRPVVYIIDGHAYVSIIDAIKHSLANDESFELQLYDKDGLIVDEQNTDGTGVRCPAFEELVRYAAQSLVLPEGVLNAVLAEIREWSDDVEPSAVRQNKGSMWVFTASIPTSRRGRRGPGRGPTHKVFLIAIGKKGHSHEEVFRRHKEDLELLRKGISMYHGGLKRNIIVGGDIHAISVDRPENSALTFTGGHGGASTHRFGCVHPLYNSSTDFFQKLPSCGRCLKEHVRVALEDLEDVLSGPELCADCANWEVYSSNNILDEVMPAVDANGKNSVYPVRKANHEPTPADVRPVIEEDTAGVTLGAFEVAFPFLSACVHHTFKQIWAKKWNLLPSKEYLRLCGVGGTFADTIANSAREQRCLPWNEVVKPDLPVSWDRGVPFFRYLCGPMHLLFLGIVDTTFELNGAALKKLFVNAAFSSEINVLLDKIRRLSIDWNKSMPLSGKKCTTGSWVSEQYLALARNMKVLYRDLWRYRSNPTTEQTDIIQQVERVVVSLSAMISRIMSPFPVTAQTITDIDRHIKIFLSCVEKLDFILNGSISPDAESHKKPRIPLWNSTANFVCLLRIPETMKQFGSLRDYWEGSLCGEKYLQRIKPLIHGVRPGDQWMKTTMQKIYDFDTLTCITEGYNGVDEITSDDDCMADGEEVEEEEEEYKRYDSVHITMSRLVLQSKLETGLDPISGFVIQSVDGREVMVIPYKTGRQALGYRRVIFNDDLGAEEVGVWYAPVSFVDPEPDLTLPETKSAIRYCSVRSFILVPGKKGYYCAVADDWTERNKKGEFSLYGITASLFGGEMHWTEE
jgi:hypothetical protein